MAIFQDFVPLKEASSHSGYHPDYIGALVRAGKVRGKKIGRNWHVLKADVEKHLATKHFIPADSFFKPRELALFGLAIVLFLVLIFVLFSDDKKLPVSATIPTSTMQIVAPSGTPLLIDKNL